MIGRFRKLSQIDILFVTSTDFSNIMLSLETILELTKKVWPLHVNVDFPKIYMYSIPYNNWNITSYKTVSLATGILEKNS